MRKPSKKQKAKSELISLIMSYALGQDNVNFFIYDLERELRSIYLVLKCTNNCAYIAGKMTELETKLLKLPKKEVLTIVKELRRKFPYVEPS